MRTLIRFVGGLVLLLTVILGIATTIALLNGRATLPTTPLAERVAYLAGNPANVYIANADGSGAQQVTFSERDVTSYDVRSDEIAYASLRVFSTRFGGVGLQDTVWLRDTRHNIDYNICQRGYRCYDPKWVPGDDRLAYALKDVDELQRSFAVLADYRHRMSLVYGLPNDIRWAANWSGDGEYFLINTHENGTDTLVIYDKYGKVVDEVPGYAGVFDPSDANTVAVLRFAGACGNLYCSEMVTVDLTTGTEMVYAPSNESTMLLNWGRNRLAVLQMNRRTEQTRIVDADGNVLVDDEHDSFGSFEWDASGTRLVYERNTLTGREIWVTDTQTGASVRVADDGYGPQWVP